MKKNIGILTFPSVVNHGAYLQVFALYNLLKENGYSVTIINYRNRKHLFNEYRALFIKKNLRSIIVNLRRFFIFRKAQKRLELKKQITNVSNIDLSGLDVVIVGADIVWNYSSPFVGRDPIFFGQGLQGVRLVSYAPSMGDSNINHDIPLYVKDNVKKNFSRISVRDENSYNLLKKIGIDSEIVLDPTLIYNFKGHEISPKIDCDYILVYAFSILQSDIDDLLSIAKERSLKIISLGFNVEYEWCDENIMSLDPLEFLGYYKGASYVFTSTFHGVLFSIKYNKVFAVRMNSTIEKKVTTILKGLKLDGQVIENSIQTCFDIKMDYRNSNLKLGNLIDKSHSFLWDAING
jgi:hypothetical protein